ncbi:EscU/YscU/HrcU family type III secretion system export apparatus switch protein [Paenibacillus glycanilyticus]|uniref:Flagellar biosynthetic protein FlhB n=1 Tax=Paenibacillus glycanilyticus TaxID=126569 RepID=A0ABQ6GBY6_9BACL|nr:EscU/YscU/HrcU family type III secretion system export apparatus switch protein [Paenibacillus glycanilyticus]GLX68464.1 flagellar biosynthetic protein FlhB [Paenibacillus glycanilyticus]
MSAEQKSNKQKNTVRKAVALKYEPGINQSPVVTAKGSGYLAEQILEQAAEHNVPVQQDSSLVEVLSKLDVDQSIPPELYTLVAEILSFVYRSDQKAREWDA